MTHIQIISDWHYSWGNWNLALFPVLLNFCTFQLSALYKPKASSWFSAGSSLWLTGSAVYPSLCGLVTVVLDSVSMINGTEGVSETLNLRKVGTTIPGYYEAITKVVPSRGSKVDHTLPCFPPQLLECAFLLNPTSQEERKRWYPISDFYFVFPIIPWAWKRGTFFLFFSYPPSFWF